MRSVHDHGKPQLRTGGAERLVGGRIRRPRRPAPRIAAEELHDFSAHRDRFGQGALHQSAASTVDTTIDYMLALDNDRVGLCLDTCHLHAAGEDPVKAIDALTEALGPTRLALLHLNDSRDPAGSRRDRHESIGKGTLGVDPFTSLLNNPRLDHIPMLVETPTNAEDVALLKTLRGKD